MTDREMILDALTPGAAYGLEIAQRVFARHGVSIPQWRLYPALREMEDEGTLTSEERGGFPGRGGRPRVYYWIAAGAGP